MTFRPAVSRQIVIMTAVISAALLGSVLVIFSLGYVLRGRGPVTGVLWFTGGLNLLLLFGSTAFRIRSYEVTSSELIIRTGFGRKVFPLAGLQETRIVEHPFAGARRDLGIGGLWSFYGRFSSAAHGAFSAYTASTGTGVMLIWPERKVLVVPDNPARFVQSVSAGK